MRIFLRGYYGGRNVGDDALLLVILRELDRLFPAASVCVTPGIESAIPNTSLRLSGRPRGRFALASTVARSDVMLYGGGGVIQEHSERGRILATHLRMSALARRFGTARIYLGVSVGPLHGSKAASRTREIVEQATLITLRDRASLRVLEEIGAQGDVRPTHDMALLLADEPPATGHRPSRPVLGVSTNPFNDAISGDRARDVELHDLIAQSLNVLMAENPDLLVKFVCFHRGHVSDLWAARYMRSRLREPERTIVFPYASDARETLAEVAACDWMLSFRLHAAIFSYIADVPIFALNYHPKIAGFAEMTGLPAGSMMPTDDLASGPLTDALEALLGGEVPQATVPLEESLIAARRNFELLAEAVRP